MGVCVDILKCVEVGVSVDIGWKCHRHLQPLPLTPNSIHTHTQPAITISFFLGCEGVAGWVDGLSLQPVAPTQTPIPSHIFIFGIFVFRHFYRSTFQFSTI
jgi:hypothetical protein